VLVRRKRTWQRPEVDNAVVIDVDHLGDSEGRPAAGNYIRSRNDP
jgi:hypothetical protein